MRQICASALPIFNFTTNKRFDNRRGEDATFDVLPSQEPSAVQIESSLILLLSNKDTKAEFTPKHNRGAMRFPTVGRKQSNHTFAFMVDFVKEK